MKRKAFLKTLLAIPAIHNLKGISNTPIDTDTPIIKEFNNKRVIVHHDKEYPHVTIMSKNNEVLPFVPMVFTKNKVEFWFDQVTEGTVIIY